MPPRPVRQNAIIAMVTRLGSGVALGVHEALAMIAFVGLIIETEFEAAISPRKLRFISIVITSRRPASMRFRSCR